MKLTLDDLVSLSNEDSAVQLINGNSAKIETALENTLSRDGTSPNQMTSNLDMNSNRILNLPAPVSSQEPIRGMDIPASIKGEKGDTGEQGPEGPEGPQGPQGEKGDTGQGLTPDFTVDTLVDRATYDSSPEGTIVLVVDEASVYVRQTSTPGTWSAAIEMGGAGNMKAENNLSDVSSVVTSRANLGVVLPKFVQARLSLLSGTPVTSSDIAAATTIYLVPYEGNVISNWNGTYWVNDEISEISLPLDADSGHAGYHPAGGCFDVFYFDDAGTKRIGTGPAWTDGTTRSAAITKKDGVWVNDASITLRWGAASGNTTTVPANQATLVGAFRTWDVAGEVYDTKNRRMLSSVTKASREMYVLDVSGPWTYSSGTLRAANSGTMQIYMFCALPTMAEVQYAPVVTNSAANWVYPWVGIGFNSSTVNAAQETGFGSCHQVYYAQPRAKWRGNIAPGLSYVIALEAGAGSDTQTWYPSGITGAQTHPFWGQVLN